MRRDIEEASATISSIVPALISGAELEFFSKTNITNSQFITLMVVFRAERCTMGQLAERLHVATPTVTGLIDRLTRLRLVRRTESEKDRRKVYIELTEKGNKMIAGFKGMVHRRWMRLLASLKPVDVANIKRIFEELGRNLENERNEKQG